MQMLGVVLLVFSVSLLSAQEPTAGSFAPSAQLSIPVRLAKTLRAEKAHPGDAVKFHTLEAVLVGNGVVMPANTLLVGRILNARAKQEGKNSWIALVVERAEWKQHSLPLRAFVSAQIDVSAANEPPPAYPNPRANESQPAPRAGRTTRVVPRDDVPGIFKTPQEATDSSQDQPVAKYPKLDNVGMVRDNTGTVYLVSSKANVRLPAGVLLMLKNEPAGSLETTAARATSGTRSSQQPR